MRLNLQGNADAVVARLGDVSPRAAANLETTVKALESELLDKVRTAAPERTGKLKQSIEGRTIATATGAIATVGANPSGGQSQGSRRDYYALWEEFGAKLPAHDILPSTKKVLHFAFGGREVFSRKVRFPGGEIDAKKFVHGPFQEMRGRIIAEIRKAVDDAL